jgi:hypothetical protein
LFTTVFHHYDVKHVGEIVVIKKVEAINKLLADQGAVVVQKKPELGNRPALYGYLPQAVFSAVNAVTSFDSTITFFEFIEKQAIAQAVVTINGVSHSQFGEAQIVISKKGNADKGSAIKGAVTDAIQKALALFGIGDQAYLGKLKDIFDGKVSQTEIDDDFETLKDAATKAAEIGLEKGRAWWRQNLAYIQVLTKEQREELVKILGAKK